jgi:hypothetical protein
MSGGVREARAVSGLPHEGAAFYFEVDRETHLRFATIIPTKILVSDDLPGLHCNMERVRVYVGEFVVFEAPLHSCEGVIYDFGAHKGI